MSNRKYPIRPWVSAHAIIFNKDRKKILLTKRAAPPKQFYWFPPGGAINLGETVEDGVKREIMEETGVKIEKLQFIDYIDGITLDKNEKVEFHFVVFMFVGDYKEGVVEAKDDALEVQWMSIEEITSDVIQVPAELHRIFKKIN
ncbi:MAG: NUDIX hydrolase [Candidatus Hodarchaeales archaeon]|jgi:ADP-ribose pyrophosphatase YjhB (NUDIX family)